MLLKPSHLVPCPFIAFPIPSLYSPSLHSVPRPFIPFPVPSSCSRSLHPIPHLPSPCHVLLSHSLSSCRSCSPSLRRVPYSLVVLPVLSLCFPSSYCVFCLLLHSPSPRRVSHPLVFPIISLCSPSDLVLEFNVCIYVWEIACNWWPAEPSWTCTWTLCRCITSTLLFLES